MIKTILNFKRIPKLPINLVQVFYKSTEYAQKSLSEEKEVSKILTDTFDRKHNYLRISLNENCNLRCHYCMPEEGVPLTPKNDILTTEEIIRLAGLFVDQGVSKIRLTGGEPLLRPDVVDVVAGLNELKPKGLKTISMTTNGIILSRKLPSLHASGLDKLNISLDTLVPVKFEFITRRKGHGSVVRAIQDALELGYTPLKINVVLMKGFNDDEVLDFVALSKDQNLDIRFIEYMPFDGNRWKRDRLVPYEDLQLIIQDAHPSFKHIRKDKSSTSKTWQLEGHKGRVSFITSMTDHFCAGCSRLRLTADGKIKVCLFDKSEVSLRDIMRQGAPDDQLLEVIAMAVRKKKARHAGMDIISKTKNRPMILIGVPRGTLNSTLSLISEPTHSSSHQTSASAFSINLFGFISKCYPCLSLRSSYPMIESFCSFYPHYLLTRSFHKSSRCAGNDAGFFGASKTLKRDFSVKENEQKKNGVDREEGSNGNEDCSKKNASSQLTHLSSDGRLRMVDVGGKRPTERVAVASGVVWLPRAVMQAVRKLEVLKGDVLVAAKVAGIMASKQTCHLIPLCHPVPVNKVHISFSFHDSCAIFQSPDPSNNPPLVITPAITSSMQGHDTSDETPSSSTIGHHSTCPHESQQSLNSTEATGLHTGQCLPPEASKRRHDCAIRVLCEVSCEGRTGVEMEALVGVSVAALTIYDMCKSLSYEIVIGDIHLVRKQGGKSDWLTNQV